MAIVKKRRKPKIFKFVAIALTISLLLSIVPVLAQNNFTAPIVLDGRKLFRVSQSGEFTAQQRATEANRILNLKIETAQSPLEVEIDRSRGIPTIAVDGSHLLSVTPEDTPRGRSVSEQAQIWEKELEEAIAQAQYERTQRYFALAVVLSIGCFILAIGFTWGLGWIKSRWLKPLLKKYPISSGDLQKQEAFLSLEVGVQILLTLIRGAIWLIALIYISRLFPQTRQLSHDIGDIIANSLFSDVFSLGENSYSVIDLIILFIFLGGLVIVARTFKDLLRSRLLSLTRLNRATQETIALIANYTFVFIGTIVVLQLWGLDLSSLTVFAGVLGVGIGLGIQGIAKEFVSGLVLMFERPIQVGDFVEVGELVGTVERIGVRSTEIRTVDQISIILPNSRFLESEVVNWSHDSPISRLKIPVGVAYGSNLTTVRTALIDATKDYIDILSDPPPRVFFTGFGDNALNLDLLVWIADPRKQFQIKSDLYFRIEARLRHRGIEIPFPQTDLHLRSGKLPLELSPELVNSLTELSNSLANWLKYH